MNNRVTFSPEEVLNIATVLGVDRGNAGRAAHAAEEAGQVDPDYAKRAFRALARILEQAEGAIETRPTAVQNEVLTGFRRKG